MTASPSGTPAADDAVTSPRERLAVLIPCYNEELTLARVAQTLADDLRSRSRGEDPAGPA